MVSTNRRVYRMGDPGGRTFFRNLYARKTGKVYVFASGLRCKLANVVPITPNPTNL